MLRNEYFVKPLSTAMTMQKNYKLEFRDLIDFETLEYPSALQYKDTQAYDPEEVQTCETNAEEICTYMYNITNQTNVTKQLLIRFAELVRNYSEFKKIKQFKVFHEPKHEHLYKLRKQLLNDAIKLYKEKGGPAGQLYIEEAEPDELTPAERERMEQQINDDKIRDSFVGGDKQKQLGVYNWRGMGFYKKTNARVGDSLVTGSFGSIFSGRPKKDLEEENTNLKIIIQKARHRMRYLWSDLIEATHGKPQTQQEKEDYQYFYQQKLNKIFGPDESFDEVHLSLLHKNYAQIAARAKAREEDLFARNEADWYASQRAS